MFDSFNHPKVKYFTRSTIVLSALALACMLFSPVASAEETSAQQVFPSSGAAVGALIAAVKADDMKALSSILGPDADQVLSSGDPVADKNAREEFASRYQEMHRLARDEQGRVILYIEAQQLAPSRFHSLQRTGDGFSILPRARKSYCPDE